MANIVRYHAANRSAEQEQLTNRLAACMCRLPDTVSAHQDGRAVGAQQNGGAGCGLLFCAAVGAKQLQKASKDAIHCRHLAATHTIQLGY